MKSNITKILLALFFVFVTSKNLHAETVLKITKLNGQATQTVAVPAGIGSSTAKVMKQYLTFKVSGNINNAIDEVSFAVRFIPQDFNPLDNPNRPKEFSSNQIIRRNLMCLIKIHAASGKKPVTLTLSPKIIPQGGLWDISPASLLGCSY
jgi:hypothetical protein